VTYYLTFRNIERRPILCVRQMFCTFVRHFRLSFCTASTSTCKWSGKAEGARPIGQVPPGRGASRETAAGGQAVQEVHRGQGGDEDDRGDSLKRRRRRNRLIFLVGVPAPSQLNATFSIALRDGTESNRCHSVYKTLVPD
jgi:hypothetical protein